MIKAYLQNKKAQYYYISNDGTVALTNDKTPLQHLPEAMESVEELASAQHKYKSFSQTGFIFRNDGLRILSHIFFKKGFAADCILTIGPQDIICGDLDFSTARVKNGKEIRISCIHF